jgi:hypothetical protein
MHLTSFGVLRVSIKNRVVSLAVIISLMGCATQSSDIAAAYISPLQYQNYDCGQLSAESQRLQARVTQIGGRLDQAASSDKAITGAGIILFWPALFFLGGTKQQEADFARIKGEYEAVQQAAVLKRCDGVVQRPSGAASPEAAASAPR